MRKSIFVVALLAILTLAGCSSFKVLDSTQSVPSSQFQTHNSVKEAYKKLENDVETEAFVTRNRVHADGFDPKTTNISIVDYISITNKFTAGGNAVAADLGIKPPEAVVTCLKAGKKCTAYRVNVEYVQMREIPDGGFGVLKSALDIEETRHTTVWKFQFLVIFHGDQAIYTQIEEDIAPTTSVNTEKNSVWKKLFRYGRKATQWP